MDFGGLGMCRGFFERIDNWKISIKMSTASNFDCIILFLFEIFLKINKCKQHVRIRAIRLEF